MRTHNTILLLISLSSASQITYGGFFSKKDSEPASCDYANIQGEEFTFATRYSGGEKYGYQSWRDQPNTYPSKSLSYEKYVGKKGKITSEKITEKYSNLFHFEKAILDNCETVYVNVQTAKPSYNDVYLTSEITRAKSLIGKTIWIKNTEVVRPQSLITANPEVSFPTHNLEALTVSDISTESFGHSTGAGSISLKLKKSSGEEGFIKFNERYFYDSNPIAEETAAPIKQAIEQQKIKIGMTPEQAILSWGKPKKINKSVGSWGVNEQWVYGDQYIYFENGKLSSFQSSN